MSKRLEVINPILAALMVLVLDTSVGIASGNFSSVQDDSLLESNNGEGDVASFCEVFQCEDKDRSPDFSPLDSGPPTMEFGWWYDFWSDSDSNGIDDRLQQIIEGERESVSKTSIIGQDGRSTVAIIVHYAWHPGTTDIDSLREVIESHGWENEGSWFMPMDLSLIHI